MAQTLYRNLPEVSLYGAVTIEEGLFVVVHKKPRSSKMLRTKFLPQDVKVARVAEENGYIVGRSQDQEEIGALTGVQMDANGLAFGEDSEGALVYFAAGACSLTGEDDEEEAAPAKKGAKAKTTAKGKAKADDEEEEEDEEGDEEAPAKAKGAKTKRRARR